MKAKWMIMLLLGALLGFASCGKDDDVSGSSLEGTEWEIVSVNSLAGGSIGDFHFSATEQINKLKMMHHMVFTSYYDYAGACFYRTKDLEGDAKWQERDGAPYVTAGEFLFLIDYTNISVASYKIDGNTLTIESLSPENYEKAMELKEGIAKEFFSDGSEKNHLQGIILNLRRELDRYRHEEEYKARKNMELGQLNWTVILNRVENK